MTLTPYSDGGAGQCSQLGQRACALAFLPPFLIVSGFLVFPFLWLVACNFGKGLDFEVKRFL